MTLANAKVLYAHFKEIGREAEAKDLERRFPELKEEPKEEPAKPNTPPSKPQKPKKDTPPPPPEKKSLLSKAKEAFKK